MTALNAREEPILDSFYLPEGFTLIYASAEVGRVEYIANAAIAECDKVAARLLTRVESGVGAEHYVTPTDMPYTRHRYWNPPP